MKIRIMTCVAAGLALATWGCDKSGNGSQREDATPVEKKAEMPKDSGGGAHGKSVELGVEEIAGFSVRASRDEGDIKPGGDAPIDVWLTQGDIADVKAVRFWIGTQEGIESVKARADIENKDEPNHWHTHAEVPKPLPDGSMLWVEIEVNDATESASFDLKA